LHSFRSSEKKIVPPLPHQATTKSGTDTSHIGLTASARYNLSAALLPIAFLVFCLHCLFPVIRHQELVEKLPSLNSPKRMRRRWLVLGEFAKYAFFWPDKEKSCF